MSLQKYEGIYALGLIEKVKELRGKDGYASIFSYHETVRPLDIGCIHNILLAVWQLPICRIKQLLII